MSLQGPFLVVADRPSPELVRSIERAGGYPVVEAGWDEAIEAVSKVEPSAVILGSTERGRDLADGLAAAIGALTGPVAPVVARWSMRDRLVTSPFSRSTARTAAAG